MGALEAVPSPSFPKGLETPGCSTPQLRQTFSLRFNPGARPMQKDFPPGPSGGRRVRDGSKKKKRKIIVSLEAQSHNHKRGSGGAVLLGLPLNCRASDHAPLRGLFFLWVLFSPYAKAKHRRPDQDKKNQGRSDQKDLPESLSGKEIKGLHSSCKKTFDRGAPAPRGTPTPHATDLTLQGGHYQRNGLAGGGETSVSSPFPEPTRHTAQLGLRGTKKNKRATDQPTNLRTSSFVLQPGRPASGACVVVCPPSPSGAAHAIL